MCFEIVPQYLLLEDANFRQYRCGGCAARYNDYGSTDVDFIEYGWGMNEVLLRLWRVFRSDSKSGCEILLGHVSFVMVEEEE